MSVISEAIRDLSDNHQLDPTTDHCKVGRSCELKSGHEVTFVSLIAHYFFEALQDRSEQPINYHKWVYMPSRSAEHRVGYDLSIGWYERVRRIRSMHKLLMNSWCDARRCWSLTPAKASDYKHFRKLIEDYRESKDVRPFLILHLSYCIHDYRRMGVHYEDEDIVIPNTSSLLRTVVIPMSEFSGEGRFADIDLERNQISLRYFRDSNSKHRDESSQAYLDRIANKENHHVEIRQNGERLGALPVQTLEEWLEESATFLFA